MKPQRLAAMRFRHFAHSTTANVQKAPAASVLSRQRAQEVWLCPCVYPVNEGMEITYDLPRRLPQRRTSVELLLSNHSMQCQQCDKNEYCELLHVARVTGARGYVRGLKDPDHNRPSSSRNRKGHVKVYSLREDVSKDVTKRARQKVFSRVRKPRLCDYCRTGGKPFVCKLAVYSLRSVYKRMSDRRAYGKIRNRAC